MIDRRIAFAAGCTLALLAARLSAQEACSVALVYPQETVFLQSDSCQAIWVCQPNPTGCYAGRLYLSDPVTVSNTIFNVTWQDYGSHDSVNFLTGDGAVALSFTGHLYLNGPGSWVLDVPNAIFSGGFDQ